MQFESRKPTTQFKTEIPAFANNNALAALLQQKGVVVNAQPLDTGSPWWQSLLLGFAPTILFVLLLFWLMRRAGSMQNILGSFGRSRARRYEATGDRVTFADVAGIDEAKEELSEVVDFLRSPDKYRRLGGRIPRGVLLSGAPGTGKTLLARAVAGEADVPFFSMAASEFVEAIVGVGAARVRDLFKEAKEAGRAIVFIDELDAVGRSRTSGVGGFSGGNDEREQTLNQILTEMDGFDPSTSVIVLGATNRPDVLDQALLRPGRFDRRVTVSPPDRVGREAILKVHTREVPLGAGRRSRPDRSDDAGHGRRRPRESRQRGCTAGRPAQSPGGRGERFHRRARAHRARCRAAGDDEPGGQAPDRVPRGRARDRRDAHRGSRPGAKGLDHPARARARRHLLGAGERPFQLPRAGGVREDQGRARRPRRRGSRVRRDQHRRRVRHPAAHRDRPPDGRPLGHERRGRPDCRDSAGRAGPLLPGVAEVSPDTQKLVDDEVRRIVDESHREVVALLQENRSRLDSLVQALLEHETLDEDDAYAAAGVERAATPAADAYALAARSRSDGESARPGQN